MQYKLEQTPVVEKLGTFLTVKTIEGNPIFVIEVPDEVVAVLLKEGNYIQLPALKLIN